MTIEASAPSTPRTAHGATLGPAIGASILAIAWGLYSLVIVFEIGRLGWPIPS